MQWVKGILVLLRSKKPSYIIVPPDKFDNNLLRKKTCLFPSCYQCCQCYQYGSICVYIYIYHYIISLSLSYSLSLSWKYWTPPTFNPKRTKPVASTKHLSHWKELTYYIPDPEKKTFRTLEQKSTTLPPYPHPHVIHIIHQAAEAGRLPQLRHPVPHLRRLGHGLGIPELPSEGGQDGTRAQGLDPRTLGVGSNKKG